MAKVILISQFPLPYAHIGSWTNMYRNYFESGQHQIDYIICEEPQNRFDNVGYEIVKNSFLTKIRRRIKNYYRINFIDALKKVIDANKGEKFIIQVVDNFSIVPHIIKMLNANGIRKDCYIQVFYHGFTPFIDVMVYLDFYETIDELVLLTNDSYQAHKAFYGTFACKVTVLYNGVNTERFFLPDADLKKKLRLESGFDDKKIFMWCSQDRPKKGLGLLLDAWKTVHAENKDTVLIVVGAKRDVVVDGVVFVGKVPNDDLPKYYQMADCYLLPTLCHEGFSLSLAEALNCGCYCIASNQGGVPEVLQYGKLGRIVNNPNYVSEWETAMSNYLSGIEQPIHLQNQIYRFEDWGANMNAIISKAKKSIS